MQRTRWFLLVTTLAALVLAGRASQADVVNEIKARGKLLVGVDVGGGSLTKDDQGRIVGYDADINALVAKELGVQLEMIDTAWEGVIPALYAKKFDMILSAMTVSRARAERVNFSVPYADSSVVLVTRADDDRIKSPRDMSGKILASQVATPVLKFLQGQDAKLKAEGLPGFKETRDYKDWPEIFLEILNKRIDGALIPIPVLVGYMAKRPGAFRVATRFEQKRYNAAAFRKADEDLLNIVNEMLKRVKRDGTLEKLQVKWFGGPMGPIPDEWVPQE